MLEIQLGYSWKELEEKNIYFSAADYYDNFVDERVVLTDFGRKVIKEVDHGEVKDIHVIVTEILGGISQNDLSGGTKALLTLYSDQSDGISLDICSMGDNCFPLLAELSEIKDIKLYTEDFRRIFTDTGLKAVKITNTGQIITNDDEWYNAYIEWYGSYVKV